MQSDGQQDPNQVGEKSLRTTEKKSLLGKGEKRRMGQEGESQANACWTFNG